MIDFDKLRAPFPPDRVSWRIGNTNKDKTSAMALAYIDARDVMERLDAVCGPGEWQCAYPHANGKTVCAIGIRVWLPDPEKQLDTPQWVWKSDGAGDSDIEAEKGALSDAFKRAAVRWGIGRYLYEVDSPWVAIEPMGKSYKIKETEYRRLRRLLTGEAPPPEKLTPEPLPDKPLDARSPHAPKPVALPFKKGEWIPLTAKPFVTQFLDIARKLPTKDARQAHYKLNEPAIQDLRSVNAETATYLDNKFAELT
jgi:hypothetical protein